MSVSLTEFKKRFGKKSVDTVNPEERYKALFKIVGPKINAGMKRGDQKALDAYAALKLRLDRKDWFGAYDVMEEVKADIAVDKGLATRLRADLATQAQRSLARNGEMPTALKAVHDSVEAAIVDDDYEDATTRLEDLTDLVDEQLRKMPLFLQRETEAADTAAKIDLRFRARHLDTPELTKTRLSYSSTSSAFSAAIDAGNLAAAETLWNKLTTLRADLFAMPDGSPEGLKKVYEDRKAADKPRLDIWLPLAGDPDPLFAGHQAALGTIKDHIDAADNAYRQAKYQEALDSLDQAMVAFPPLIDAVKAQDNQAGLVTGQFRKDVINAIRKPPIPDYVPGDIDTDALVKANAARAIAQTAGNYVLALRKCTEMTPGLQRIWAEMQRHQPQAPQQPDPGIKAGQYRQLIAGGDRKSITTALNAPDADLAMFRAQPGATKLLDDMVKAIGNKADNAEKKEFIKAAMKARYGLTSVTGGDDGKGMSTKALPRLYKLFGMLPASHTTDNDLITSVERLKVNDTSTHSAQNKKIVLKAGETGSEGGNFDDTTLHEIAHGVDAKFHFMDNNGGARKFGGWRNETKDSVKKVAAEELGFVRYFTGKNVDASLLDKYLDLCLTGSSPKTLKDQFAAAKNPALTNPDELKKHAAVKHAMAGQQAARNDDDNKRDLTLAARKLIKDREPLKSMLSTIVEEIAYGKSDTNAIKDLLDSLAFDGDAPADAVWEEMAVHPAVDFASNVGLKGGGASGLWDQGDAGASRYAVNGRVYQQAYSWAWVSYLLSARGAKVCNYQFRYQMEWFAECYSRFFLGTLAPNHPLASWLREQKNAAPKT